MGYGTITGGGADGRYTISLDYGEGTKTAYLAALNTQLEKLNSDLLIAEAKLAEKQAEAQLVQDEINAGTTAYIDAGGTGNMGAPAVQAALFFLEQQKKAYIAAQRLTIDARLKVEAIKLARAQTLDYIVRWNAAVLTETKDAWCTDLTEDGSGPVATIDINGESNLTLIAPGCRGWNGNDGYMRAPDVMSPAGAYWNLAAAPGWQKWNPTYRWGTISSIDTDADTCSVNLASASSSQQSLGINQSSTLSNVPVVYMTCNARAFEEGDRVVVQFLGQDWSNPRVIGFLDNPKPCLQYTASYYVIGYGPFSSGNNHLFDTVEKYKDELWGDFSTITPATPWKFIQWSDGVTTLTRNDGTATENISRTARYTYAPNFRLTYSWDVTASATSGTYFDGSNFVKDWEVRVTGSNSWSAIGYATPPTSPTSGAFDEVVWVGQAIDGASPDDVMQELTLEWTGITSSPGPIYFPSFPTGTAQTVVFVLSGSANQYTVNGTSGSNPYPGGAIPSTGSGTGALTTIDYTADTWSAVYA